MVSEAVGGCEFGITLGQPLGKFDEKEKAEDLKPQEKFMMKIPGYDWKWFGL